MLVARSTRVAGATPLVLAVVDVALALGVVEVCDG